MAKVNVTISWEERATFSRDVVISVTRDEVVEALDLTGEDRVEWREHIEDWIYSEGVEALADETADGPFVINEVGPPNAGDTETENPELIEVEVMT
tara:strand:- start:4777 stop:5064 length:288 start_codon:yes stop_codon:yes gene_type:complete